MSKHAVINADAKVPTYAALQARRAVIGPRLPSAYTHDSLTDVTDNWIDHVDPENAFGAIATAFFNDGEFMQMVVEINGGAAVYDRDTSERLLTRDTVNHIEAMEATQ